MFALERGGQGKGEERKASREAPALEQNVQASRKPSPCLVIRCLEGGVLQLSTSGLGWLPVDSLMSCIPLGQSEAWVFSQWDFLFLM